MRLIPPRLVLLYGLLLGVGLVVAWHPWSAFVAPHSPDLTDAKVVCRDFVKDRLRAPATAQFAPYTDQTATAQGTTMTVRGYVDSQNGFGANLRTTYDCVVRPPARQDGEWSLVSLNTSP